MSRSRFVRWACVLLAAIFAGAVLGPGAIHAQPSMPPVDLFELAIGKSDLDVDQSYSMVESSKVRTSSIPANLRTVMGVSRENNSDYDARWTGGSVGGDTKSDTFHYVIWFRAPVSPGSLLFTGTPQSVSVLKPDAPMPADPANDNQWQPLTIPASQADTKIVPLPVGTQFRALRLTDHRTSGTSTLWKIQLLKHRLGNLTPLSEAYAQTEYATIGSGFGPSVLMAARRVQTATGSWQNSGPNERGHFTRAPITDVDPTWFMLTWERKQSISGLWIQGNLTSAEVDTYDGDETINPRAGTERDWKTIQNVRTSSHGGMLLEFDPIQTRGVRLRILGVDGLINSSVAKIDSLETLIDLKSDPMPDAGLQEIPNPPVSWTYDLKSEGSVTMAIDDEQGRRVRNLFAREMRPAGVNTAYWDLRDEQGRTVGPGKYHWKGITLPGGQLGLRYEMTPFPNVHDTSPENAPWLTNFEGADGWMADHSPPFASATFGDRMYLGAPVSESGVSLICTDLTGRKLWAHSSFAGFTGAWWLGADAKNVYVGAHASNTAAAWKVDPTTEAIWAVDTQSHAVREVARLQPSGVRKRGIQSMLADEGKVYLSVKAQENWFSTAAAGGDVDINNCEPLYKPKGKEKFLFEIVPDAQNDFMRLFRTTDVPAGGGGSVPGDLIYLETTGGTSSRQYIVLAFKHPVPIGSVVFPVPRDPKTVIKVSVLKPEAAYPPNPSRQGDWTPFETDAKAPWDVATAAPQTLTRAIRVMFVRGVDDIFTEGDDVKVGASDSGAKDDLGSSKGGSGSGGGALSDKEAWKGQIEGMTLFARRFANVATSAKIQVNSGRIDAEGVWDARRKEPLTEASPGIYAMVWDQAQSIRGLAIKEIDGKRTLVDVYTGPAGGPIDIKSSAGWTQVSEYIQSRRDLHSGFAAYNGDARYVDGYVDFGKEISTRAIRLRVVDQWSDNLPDSRGVRRDQGGTDLDPKRCRIYGVAAMKYLGGEARSDPMTYHRIEVIDGQTGSVVRETPIDEPGPIAMTPQKELLAVSGTTVVKVDFDHGQHRKLIDGLVEPQAMAVDARGNIYVYDNAPDRKTIGVYDATGKFQRTIGTPGGFKLGPWDPNRFNNIYSLSIDQQDQLWAVDATWPTPKRVSIMKTDGTFIKDLLGNTLYGGGGVLDPWDKRKLYHLGLEFELDWDTGKTRLKNYLWPGADQPGEIPIRINDRTYLVTRALDANSSQNCGVVYLYEKDHLRRVAAMGLANAFPPLNTTAMRSAFGFKNLTEYSFIWSDLNGDGQVQPDEVTLIPRTQVASPLSNFNRDLGVQAGSVHYEVKEFLPSGVPVYTYRKMPGIPDDLTYRIDNEKTFVIGADDHVPQPERVLDSAGKALWTYPSLGISVGGMAKSGSYTPGQVVCEYGVIGHETYPGDLGEFLVLDGNLGSWNLWTTDGLLAGRVFRDLRDFKARTWSMRQHERGMSLDNLTVGQEHFQGYLCMTQEDHKVYAVAGHNHISVVEVTGMDTFKRMSGTVDVSVEKSLATQAWEQVAQKKVLFTRAPVIDCYRVRTPPTIDGDASDWAFASATMGDVATFRMCFDDRNLYVCYRTQGVGPLKNTGSQWDRLFKTGASVDLQISSDPEAPNDRQAPVKGDKRLLMTVMEGKPIAVLYDAVAPGTPAEQNWEAVSPVAKVSFDRVVKVPEVTLATQPGRGDGYVVEAAIPWKVLDIKPEANLRLRMDWGVLSSDDEGNAVLRRLYWANKATGIIADVPSEARLTPGLWGYVIFHNKSPLTQPDVSSQKIDLGAKGGPKSGDKVDRFMNELEDGSK